MVLLSVWATPALPADCDQSMDPLVRLAADRIDAVFRDVAASTRTLGEEYRKLVAHRLPATDEEMAAWVSRGATSGSTTGYRTWPEGSPTPAFQAAFPGFYRYHGETLTHEKVANLQAFERLLPLFRAAYRSFDFSWVYLTTADDMMLIYPYLPMDQAMNNDLPTGQIYYQAADFQRRAVGWTLPYLDLVGAGMMITASYPIYDEDRLLGVSSRDITLKQLSQSVLTHLTRGDDTSAFIVDKRGLAIDASDPELAAELEAVNSEKKAAALYFRTPAGLASQTRRGAVASRVDWVNEITERILARAARPGVSDVIALESDGRQVVATRIESTGWFVILVFGHS